MSSTQAAAVTELPSWAEEIRLAYASGTASVFCLYGNIFDYTDSEHQLSVRAYLAALFGQRATVVQYAPDEGITFPGPEKSIAKPAEARYRKLMGLEAQTGQQSRTAAMMAAQRGSGPVSTEGPPPLPTGQVPAINQMCEFLEIASADKKQIDKNGDALSEDGKSAVAIIDRCDLIVPPGDKALIPESKLAMLARLHRIGRSQAMSKRGNVLVLLTPTLEEIHPDLRLNSASIKAIEVMLPDYEQRLGYVKRLQSLDDVPLVLEGITPQELAATTAGLGRRHLEDLSMLASANDPPVLTRDLVRRRKAELILSEYAGVLEILESSVTLEMVGGHKEAKEYLKDFVITPMQRPDLADLVPMGVALLGPSGTGKTFLANALANAIGYNCVILKPSNLKGGIVGQSERLLARAFAGIEANSPCLVFWDEIDQGGRRTEGTAGDGGSAVEANAFGALLAFLGDPSHRGRILAVAASNRPDLVDAAIFRPGRFDKKIPLLPPEGDDERAQVLKALIWRKIGVDKLSDAFLLEIGSRTVDWTQAALENLVMNALALSRIKKMGLDEAMTVALGRMRSATRSVRWMAELALAECDDTALVPERWRSFVGLGREPEDDESTSSESEVPGVQRVRRERPLFD